MWRDGIDSSKDAGKLMISVLSAVAEIERENIRVQTMEGRDAESQERQMELQSILKIMESIQDSQTE